MDNSDERDYEEEAANRRLMLEVDESDNYHTMDESAQEVEDRANADIQEQNYRDAADATILDETPLPIGYGDEWDGSSRNQTNNFFIGHSGHVTILWHVTNNPFEKYDSSKSYHTPALDGSALYVWCDLKFTDHQALLYIEQASEQLSELGSTHTMTKFIS
jgi:hypothetical protein